MPCFVICWWSTYILICLIWHSHLVKNLLFLVNKQFLLLLELYMITYGIWSNNLFWYNNFIIIRITFNATLNHIFKLISAFPSHSPSELSSSSNVFTFCEKEIKKDIQAVFKPVVKKNNYRFVGVKIFQHIMLLAILKSLDLKILFEIG